MINERLIFIVPRNVESYYIGHFTRNSACYGVFSATFFYLKQQNNTRERGAVTYAKVILMTRSNSNKSRTTHAHLQREDGQEQHQPTSELHETDGSFQNFKRIIESTHDSVISLDMEGRVTYWSPSSEALYGYKSEEVIGQPLKSFLLPEERKKEFS